jgi:hypothetical protein
MSSNDHQFATVNLNGKTAEAIRLVMRQTGWTVEQSLAWLLSTTNPDHVPTVQTAIEGNEVGVQVVKNTITSYPFEVGAVVSVSVPTEDDDYTLKLYGTVIGFAPQGPCVKLTSRSIAEAKSYDIHIHGEDLWSYEDVTAL